MNTEPAWTVGSITAAVSALVGLLVAFGLPITDGQQNAILAFVGVAAPLVVAWLVRSRVVPSSQVVAKAETNGEITAGDGSVFTTGLVVEPDVPVGTLATGE